LVLRGLLELSSSDQLLAARRSFDEARPLFQLAERKGYRGPSPARAYMLMAALETRYGHVDRALPLLESSVSMEQNAGVTLRLAQLQFQQKETKAALVSVKKAVDLAQKTGDLLLEAEAEEVQFRFLRATGKLPEAGEALGRALSRTLVLLNMEVSLRSAAPVERQLASILGYYGRETEVRSAYDRALEASGSDLLELEVTLTDMARAALTLGDVRLGRRATQSALDMGLPAENSIYIALWQQLLETRSAATRDGISREVLSRADKARGWLGTLRKFGLGEIPKERLSDLAVGIPESAEADFYVALSGEEAKVALKEVAASPALDLIEVRIAQDLIAETPVFELPEDVVLP
jgi:tetratricopeptide (TPR) repeat protein